MKHVPNIITAGRMALSVMLVFLLNDRELFFAVFILCGLSDLLDGLIARRTKTGSATGARLDAAADLLMFGVVTASVIIWKGVGLEGLLPYLSAVVLIRIANMIIAAVKYRSFAIVHTWGNKITGLAVFLSYAVFILADDVRVFLPVCILAAVSALEECAIHLTSDELDLNRPGIFKFSSTQNPPDKP